VQDIAEEAEEEKQGTMRPKESKKCLPEGSSRWMNLFASELLTGNILILDTWYQS
jgi:hypothetical protein